jgi:hypothetical protein
MVKVDMKSIRVPAEVLATEIRNGHVAVGTLGGSAATGALGHVASEMAAKGLRTAAEAGQPAAGLRFPPHCCNCLASGSRVRPVETASIVNRGVAYTFTFPVPHCGNCTDTAKRKRPGMLGTMAAFLTVSVPAIIVMLGFGAAYNNDALIGASLVAGPALGIAIPYLWTRMRKPRPGQASWYQAAYVSAVEVAFSGVPKSFTLTFENDAYADKFISLNKDLRVVLV